MSKQKVIGVDAAKLAGLQIELLDKLRHGQISVQQFEKFLHMSSAERDHVLGLEKPVQFKLLRTISLTVPDDYEPDHVRRTKEWGTMEWDAAYDSPRHTWLMRAVDHLKAGQRYTIRIWSMDPDLSVFQIKKFAEREKAMCVGLYGLILLWQSSQRSFPMNTYTFSPDLSSWEIPRLELTGKVWYLGSGHPYHDDKAHSRLLLFYPYEE